MKWPMSLSGELAMVYGPWNKRSWICSLVWSRSMSHNLLVSDEADVRVNKPSAGKLQRSPGCLEEGPRRTQKPGHVTQLESVTSVKRARTKYHTTAMVKTAK